MKNIPIKTHTGLSDRALNKTDRLFALLLLLQNKPNLTTKQLAEHFKVSRRTIFRDLRILEESGVPLTYTEEGGGYEILDGYQLPPLMLTAKEAAVLLAGTGFAKFQTDTSLQTDADQVAMKIRTILPRSIQEYVDRLQQRTVFDPYWHVTQQPNQTERSGVWYEISEAIARQHPLFVTYHVESRNETTKRKIDPLGIVFYFDHWTLVGYCHLRKEIRSFRLDQIRTLFTMSERFSGYESFNLQKFLEEKGMGRQQRFVLHFSSKIYAFARLRIPARIEEETPTESGTTVIFYFDNLDYLANWLLQFGAQVQILEPMALVGKMQALLKEMLQSLQMG